MAVVDDAVASNTEHRRRVFAAAAFVFLAGFARAGGAAGDGGAFRPARIGFVLQNCAEAGCARLFCVVCGDECGVEAFGLEAAEFLEGAVEGALGGGAGAVDGDLKAVEFFVGQVFRRSDFERGAAAETPGGVDDFAGEGLFERRIGREFGEVAGFEFIKDVLFFGADEIGDGEETEFGCVLRDAGSAFGRDRAGGVFGVLPIGQDLSGAGHCGKIIAEVSRAVT